MANVKMSTVGATKSLEIWLRFNKRCFNCSRELTFKQCQIEHIIPQSYYANRNLPCNNSKENLACLCKECNVRKGSKEAKIFYGKRYAELMKIVTMDLDKEYVFQQGEIVAKNNPCGKFARLFRSGKFYQGIN